MICPYCLGTDFEAGLFDEPVMLRDRLVLFHNVPALRCTQCDELIFGPESGRLKDRALAQGRTGTREIECYDLAQVASAPELEAALAIARAHDEETHHAAG